MKIVEYRIEKNSTESSVRLINALIINGWQPHGAPFGDSIVGYFQALVKYEEDPKAVLTIEPVHIHDNFCRNYGKCSE